MLFRQMLDPAKGCASYLIGCGKAGEAVVVDPLGSLGVEAYLLEAADLGVEIVRVIDTHLHADHISLGVSLARALNVPYCLSELAAPLVSFAFTPLKDGEEVTVGKVRLRVINTPGHTPESICLLGTDGARADEPWFVLTGDTLMVGDVGRPDLVLGNASLDVMSMQERALHLYCNIRERLLTLPDYVEVFPGHFGGSTCGGVHMSGKTCSTIGFELRHNLALQYASAEAFAASVGAGLRPQPASFQVIKRRNMGREEG
jgi:glyoxylase-like metal-dependent hydrolase (beta-lactamase superfamily II)